MGHNELMDKNGVFRVATWNIHKGVRGVGPTRRLEILDIGHGVEQLDADVICLQEVRKLHRREEQHFTRWPAMPQADFLAPEGYEAVYRTNAYTKHGEHGNALLSCWPVLTHQHEDMSDHRFEQRGLLHVEIDVDGHPVHVIVVHLGLIPGSRVRQTEQLRRYIAREVNPSLPLVVAGDFNDWGDTLRRALRHDGLLELESTRNPTFPSRLPLVQLDHIYARGLTAISAQVPRGRAWARMSDHLPLVTEFQL
ncbi:endonuclease/exonuclease/phosphatase family protein [Curvibacter microcysteis]|uniref:endonuclease/exonuclease/phosphatase family protein n=1 Tax=Curvibacter microcysteis TaxID=3026419 RepID=UPI003907F5FB